MQVRPPWIRVQKLKKLPFATTGILVPLGPTFCCRFLGSQEAGKVGLQKEQIMPEAIISCHADILLASVDYIQEVKYRQGDPRPLGAYVLHRWLLGPLKYL